MEFRQNKKVVGSLALALISVLSVLHTSASSTNEYQEQSIGFVTSMMNRQQALGLGSGIQWSAVVAIEMPSWVWSGVLSTLLAITAGVVFFAWLVQESSEANKKNAHYTAIDQENEEFGGFRLNSVPVSPAGSDEERDSFAKNSNALPAKKEFPADKVDIDEEEQNNRFGGFRLPSVEVPDPESTPEMDVRKTLETLHADKRKAAAAHKMALFSQSHFRGQQARVIYNQRLETKRRSSEARRRFFALTKGVTKVQAIVRRNRARKQLELMKQSS